jgi:hypothetical protein
MTLADLVDLEVQLVRDRGADPAALEARDRRLLPPGASARGRAAVLRDWIGALREQDPASARPGRAVMGALRAVRSLLVIAGLLLGWGTATAVLQFTGGHPVNVWDFLLVFVGLQLALLVLLLASFLLPVDEAGAPLLGLARSIVGAIFRRLVVRGFRGEERVEEWRVLWHTLRARRSLYHGVEPWILLGLTQSFGVAFNVAALAAMLRLVVFSDLAFSWSTTLLELDPARFHTVVRALSAPWAWLWPDAVPSSALVEATRYSRLEGAYLLSGARRTSQPALVGAWWPFLAASLTFYGLLPRAVLLVVSGLRASRLVARLPFDDLEISRVVGRLTAPDVQTRSPDREAPAPSWPGTAPDAADSADAGCERCVTVLWRDVPAGPTLDSALARRLRCDVRAAEVAGGRDYDERRVDWGRVTSGAEAAIVVAEGWEPPDRSVLRLLRSLRDALGPRRPIRVVLLGPVDGARITPAATTDVQLWREGLARLADPFVSVESLPEAP